MADTAAHLVDKVLPDEPIRQWVLSVPWAVRFDLTRNATLFSEVVRAFAKEILRSTCKRAGLKRFSRTACGAVSALQRWGSSLNTHPHIHTVALDGVYLPAKEGEKPACAAGAPAASAGRRPEFHALPPPDREDLEKVLARVRKKIAKLLRKHGCASALPAEEMIQVASESAEEPGTLDLFQAASIQGHVGVLGFPHPAEVVGKREVESVPAGKKRFSVEDEGYSLHAGVRISGCDKEGREQLCRYLLRPPFAVERFRKLSDGRILYEFRKTRFDGATHVVLDPLELLEKLAALVAPPRRHLLHSAGVFAPHARRRSDVIPRPGGETAAESATEKPASKGAPESAARAGSAEPEPASRERGENEPASEREDARSGGPDHDDCGRRRRREREEGEACPERSEVSRSPRRTRTDWATLMRRTLFVDVLACNRCGSRMKVLSCITEGAVIRKILESMGLWADPPRLSPARPPPGPAFDSDQLE